MMNEPGQKRVNVVLMSALLSFVAGYADTTTFICANRLFSARVTGNFVVFVFSLVTNARLSVWMNLFAFPFFIAAVVAGSFIASYSKYPGHILRAEALLLLITGIIASALRLAGIETTMSVFLLAMLVVFAMGLQNAFGRLYPYATYSATTLMTGNVTQLTLDFMRNSKTGTRSVESTKSLRGLGLIIGFFFVGCILGGVLSYWAGLQVIILPGLVMGYFWTMRRKLILLDEKGL